MGFRISENSGPEATHLGQPSLYVDGRADPLPLRVDMIEPW